jgi:hypothetical protein
VVNALFSAELADDEFESLEHDLAPHTPLRGVRVVDSSRLRVTDGRGGSPFLLHHTLTKPWLAVTVPNAYSRLLPRLLLADDVTLRLVSTDVPRRLRTGPLAAADRLRCAAQAGARTIARRQLGRLGIRTRLAEARAARRLSRAERSWDGRPNS